MVVTVRRLKSPPAIEPTSTESRHSRLRQEHPFQDGHWCVVSSAFDEETARKQLKRTLALVMMTIVLRNISAASLFGNCR